MSTLNFINFKLHPGLKLRQTTRAEPQLTQTANNTFTYRLGRGEGKQGRTQIRRFDHADDLMHQLQYVKKFYFLLHLSPFCFRDFKKNSLNFS